MRNVGHYLASMNLFLQAGTSETVNASVTLQYGSQNDTFILSLKNRLVKFMILDFVTVDRQASLCTSARRKLWINLN